MRTRVHDRRLEVPNRKAERPGLAVRVEVTKKETALLRLRSIDLRAPESSPGDVQAVVCGAVVGAECATFVMRKPMFAQHAAQVTSDLSISACGYVAQLAHVAQRFF
jgi:hypothetical protein